MHLDDEQRAARHVPGAQPVQRRGVRPARRPPGAGGRDPDAHARRGDATTLEYAVRDARVQGGAARGLRAATGRRGRRPRSRARAVRAVDRHVRHRQRVRLRPGVGEVPRARRRRVVPLRLDRLGQPHVDLELHVQPPRPSRRGPARARASRCSWAASPAASPTCRSRSSRAARRGRVALYSDLIGHWEKRNARAMDHLEPGEPRPRRCSATLLAQYGSKAGTNPASRPAARAPGGPGDARRVGAPCGIETRGGHPRPVRAELLLRVRGRRPAHRERVQHQAQPVRRTAPGHVRLRPLALGRARHDRGARGGVGDGRARAGSPTTTSATSCSPTRSSFFTRTNPAFFAGTVVEADVDEAPRRHRRPGA